MRRELAKIEKLQHHLDEMLDNRNDVYAERSEKWQESEAGEYYDSKTDQLEEVYAIVEDLKETMQDWLEK